MATSELGEEKNSLRKEEVGTYQHLGGRKEKRTWGKKGGGREKKEKEYADHDEYLGLRTDGKKKLVADGWEITQVGGEAGTFKIGTGGLT